jgi:hypothetical protein
MLQRLTALFLLLVLLAPGASALHAAVADEDGRSSHACCPEQLRATCHGQTIACCEPTGQPSTPNALPASASLSHAAGVPLLDGPAVLVLDAAAEVRRTARLAHAAEARLQAPADPIFLKNLVLLV